MLWLRSPEVGPSFEGVFMNLTAAEPRDENKSIPSFPVRRTQRLSSALREPERLLVPVLGSKVVYQISAETFPPVTNLN
jgi:hypothetical protein